MSNWVNFHSHNNFCDGTDEPEIYIEEAIHLELPAYGFSSHAPVFFKTDWCIPDSRFEEYLIEIIRLKEQYKNLIQVYLGLEIDFIPEFAGRSKHLLKDVSLDYFIGSVHFVEKFQNGTYWNIDTSYELFLKGLHEIFKSDFRKAATRYFEITREMIEEDRPDIIGHIDKIKMYNSKGKFFNENEKWYQDQVDLTIETLKNKGGIVEINTRGYYKYQQTELYPSDWIIKKLVQNEIPLMINSDSHKPSEIILGMEYASKKLKTLSVLKIRSLFNSQWLDFEFDEKGILFS
jgi:histidinol-phosphatase (PHP family)